ncbi:MAG: hypothetical protein AAB795_01065 [Patescibacteria group bacterium]
MNNVFGSIEHQKDLFTRFWYDYSKWDKDDPKEVHKLANLALGALLNGVDANGMALSSDDMKLLSSITKIG